jgi:hypothetical protein
MPVVSQAQGKAMNLAHAIQTGQAKAKPGTPSADIASTMKPSSLSDFTGPIPAGLPKKVAPAPVPPSSPPPQVPGAPPRVPPRPVTNVGGPGPGRPPAGGGMKVKNVGKPVKKFKF